MSEIRSAIACNLDTNILLASLPLFESGNVQAIEWSFDSLYQYDQIPDWFADLLKAYSQANGLIGHGVFFSLFSGKWTNDQQTWLNRLKNLCADYTFDHITEHFGFMTGEDFHKGAPISIPFTPSTLALGQDRLKRIQNACNCPVGLENLAFAYSLDDVNQHGEFLNQLVEPINGFIILDLHNLYCQIHNFEVDFSDLLARYPLDKVREIHISGGSWTPSQVDHRKKIRRDTHDDAVPAAVFALLEQTIPRCPNLKFVVLEQLGNGLTTTESQRLFQQDFFKMDKLVAATNRHYGLVPTNSFLPSTSIEPDDFPVEDHLLHSQQTMLSAILENSVDYRQAQISLQASALANTAWKVERWEPSLLETAINIAQKWKNGFG